MGLGNRSARRHESTKTAGVNPEDYWDFKPGQSVMTVDGFMGKVTAVNDGPLAGTESYEVTLVNGLGGGEYTASQLTAANNRAAAHENTASVDYPELAEILQDRPDPGKYPESTMGMTASLQTTAKGVQHIDEAIAGYAAHAGRGAPDAQGKVDSSGLYSSEGLAEIYHPRVRQLLDLQGQGFTHAEWGWDDEKKHNRWHGRHDPTIGMESSRHQADLIPGTESNEGKPPSVCDNGHLKWGDTCPGCRDADPSQNAMVVNPGDNKPQDVERVKNASKDACAHCGSTEHSTAQCGSESMGREAAWWDHDDHSGLNPVSLDELDALHAEHADKINQQYAQENPARGDGCTVCGDSDHATHQHIDDDVRQRAQNAWGVDPKVHTSVNHGYAMIRQAALQPSLAFHVCAAWADVRRKARRIRAEGGVHITTAEKGYVVGQVKGDHDTYESVLMRAPGTQKVAQWDCACPWAKYHWGAPDDFSRFAGRMCSHTLALHFESQSRGMFGRDVAPDEGNPNWLTRKDLALTSSLKPLNLPDCAPIHVFAALALSAGAKPEPLSDFLATVAHVNSGIGEPVPERTIGNGVHGPTAPRDPNENPAQGGFLTAADPDTWNGQSPSMGGTYASKQASLDPRLAWAQLIVPLVKKFGPQLVKALPGLAGGNDDEDETPKNNFGGADPEPERQQSDWPQKLKAWTDQDKAEGMNALYEQHRYSTLNDEPEAALPTTDGSEGDDLADSLDVPSLAPDEVFIAGDAVKQPKAASSEFQPFQAPMQEFADRWGHGVYPDATDVGGTATGTVFETGSSDSGSMGAGSANFKADPTSLEPEDPSFVSTGSVAAAGSVEDIVAQFQATSSLGGSTGAAPIAKQRQENSEIAQAARAFLEGGQDALQRTAMAVFTPAQQQEMINEGEGGPGASNLDRLKIEGTHYESLDQMTGSNDDDEGWLDA